MAYYAGKPFARGSGTGAGDYDGDIRLPLGERRIKRSPLRDVASMLQSVAVTAGRGYERCIVHAATEAPLLSDWLERWLAAVCGTFFTAYLDAAGDADCLPPDDRRGGFA
jgi:maltose alpha-D-glucosyltransferase/alpha-amylase